MRQALNSARTCAIGMVLATGLALVSPASAANTPEEEANKQVVLDFYAALNKADAANSIGERARAITDKYLSPEWHRACRASVRTPSWPRATA
jgi:hypothetical protein